MAISHRPQIHTIVTSYELKSWYWTKEELISFAVRLRVKQSGSKTELTARLSAKLDGKALAEPILKKTGTIKQLKLPVTRETIIPVGQRSSQILRHFFEQEIGGSFHFDAFMRDYITHNAGKTLGDAVAHWRATRSAAREPRPISAQFKYNTFLRDWHKNNPDKTRQEALRAWYSYRNKPKR